MKAEMTTYDVDESNKKVITKLRLKRHYTQTRKLWEKLIYDNPADLDKVHVCVCARVKHITISFKMHCQRSITLHRSRWRWFSTESTGAVAIFSIIDLRVVAIPCKCISSFNNNSDSVPLSATFFARFCVCWMLCNDPSVCCSALSVSVNQTYWNCFNSSGAMSS